MSLVAVLTREFNSRFCSLIRNLGILLIRFFNLNMTDNVIDIVHYGESDLESHGPNVHYALKL